MFIVSLSYIKPIAEVELHLAAHVEYLKKQFENGAFIAAGRKVPRTGGIILANAASRAELEVTLAADPFQQQQVAKYEITEFIPTMTLPEFSALIP